MEEGKNEDEGRISRRERKRKGEKSRKRRKIST